MAEHSNRVVSHEEWLEARKQLLTKEKEYTRLGDRLSEERRHLPWERVEKEYVFDGPAGRDGLAELFAGDSQLAVYHFMFGRDWDRQALKAGATSLSEPADMFWGGRVAQVSDQFGNQWWIATHKEDVAAQEMQKRAEEAMKQQHQ